MQTHDENLLFLLEREIRRRKPCKVKKGIEIYSASVRDPNLAEIRLEPRFDSYTRGRNRNRAEEGERGVETKRVRRKISHE